MICKRLLFDFRKDAKYWAILMVSLAVITLLGVLDGKGLMNSVAGVIFLLIFMLLTAALSDLFAFILYRETIRFYWVPFAGAAVLVALLYHYVFTLSARAILGLVIVSAVLGAVLTVLIVKRSA